MTHWMRSAPARTAVIIALLSLAGCASEKSGHREAKELAKQEKKDEKGENKGQAQHDSKGDGGAAPASVSTFASAGCDESLWAHVYNPTRLEKLAPCVSVKGTIEESSANDDGDQHFLLKLDAGQETLLNKINVKKKNGDLVIEIVCANPVAVAKARSACVGYRNTIPTPVVGAHVMVTGSYVIDSHNGWAEIHPVSTLTKGS